MAVVSAATEAVRPAPSLDIPAMVKDSALAALIAFALFVTMVGLRIVEVQGCQAIETRFLDVIVAVVLVFIGRMGMILVRQGYPLPVLIGGGVVAACGLLLPLPSSVLQLVCIAGAVVLSIIAAKRLAVPMTILVSVGIGAALLGLALNVVSATSNVLEILVLWYGGLAVVIGLSTHPRATDGRAHVIGVPVRVLGILAVGAAVLAVLLVTGGYMVWATLAAG